MNPEWLQALVGGVLIGLAVSLMLLLNGRVTGISGIIYGLFNPTKGDIGWRINFIFGLVIGGLFFKPSFNFAEVNWQLPLAGLLVGFGTVLGSGCTSGHGVCGISRMSIRSIIATAVFMISGIAAVGLLKYFGALS